MAEPSSRHVGWEDTDSIPFSEGLVKRKDVYSDSVSILWQVGLPDQRRRWCGGDFHSAA